MSGHREELLELIRQTSERAKLEPLSLNAVLLKLKDSGFSLVGILICLPFIFPVSVLGPLTIPGGLAIAALGWQMARGRDSITLPRKIAQVQLGETAWAALLKACEKVMSVCDRFAKPRLSHWTDGKSGEKRTGWFLFVGGALLAIPMGGLVPFSNTLPALIGICACIAKLERDGYWFIFAVFWLVLTILYFGVLAYLALYFGAELKAWIEANLPAWI